MTVVFNIGLILLVLLIAYWWANQGLFSAVLHLLCVIVAGAITLAVWEPLTVGLALQGTQFDDYAWGVCFIGVFVISLLILRVTMDKSVRANLQFPPMANLLIGFPVGAVAGILTVGIFLIGAGFIQSNRDIMGFVGWGRATQDGRVKQGDRLWLPVHQLTYEFYSFLSVGSLYPTFNDTPLRRYNPNLDALAISLVRDSAKEGRAKLSLKPSAARVTDAVYCNDSQTNRIAVGLFFDAGARDFGEQLTLSSAQIRLIGDARGSAEPVVLFPVAWTQYDGFHSFDDVTHYITSEPGQSQANVRVEFDARQLGNSQPKFIQIRGTRYRIPLEAGGRVRQVTSVEFADGRRAGATGGFASVAVDATARSIQTALEQSNSIRPITASTNQKPAGIQVSESLFIIGGDGDFDRAGGERPSRNLMIKGIDEPSGTRIVQVNVSRESAANIFGSVKEKTGNDSKIMLVDSSGRPYLPIGFIHDKPDNKTRIFVDFQNYITRFDQLPMLPSAGGQTLRLLFSVTENATITGFKVGDVTVGTCSFLVQDPKAAQPSGSTGLRAPG